MTDKDILTERVLTLISTTTNKDRSEISLSSRVEDLSHDSLELFSLISTFEREFSLKAAYHDLLQIETVAHIIEYLTKHLSQEKTLTSQ